MLIPLCSVFCQNTAQVKKTKKAQVPIETKHRQASYYILSLSICYIFIGVLSVSMLISICSNKKKKNAQVLVKIKHRQASYDILSLSICYFYFNWILSFRMLIPVCFFSRLKPRSSKKNVQVLVKRSVIRSVTPVCLHKFATFILIESYLLKWLFLFILYSARTQFN